MVGEFESQLGIRYCCCASTLGSRPEMRRGRTPSDQPRSPDQLLRTPSGSMLRTKSGRRLVTDDRRWLLLGVRQQRSGGT